MASNSAEQQEVHKGLEDQNKTGHVIRTHSSSENIIKKYPLSGVTMVSTPINWSKDSQKMIFISMRKGCINWLLL